MIYRIFTILSFIMIYSMNLGAQELVPVPLEVDNIDLKVRFDSDSPEQDVYETNYVHSTVDEHMVLTWEKIIDFTSNRAWGFEVCDNMKCYFDTVFSKDFELEPYATGEMTVHLQRYGQSGDSAVIYVRIFRSDIDNSDSLYLKVSFYEESVTSTVMTQVELNEVQVFPNPATHYVNVKSPSRIGEVVVHDILGRKLLSQNLSGKNSGIVSIESLREGTYFITVYNQKGEKLKTSRLIKQVGGS